MSLSSRTRTLFLALAACLAFSPAQAQLDPRLQVVATDLLQVYQSTPAKPELLTCYDFSGSMHAVYWTGTYYTDPAESNHTAQWALTPANYSTSTYGAIPNSGDFPGLVPVITSTGKVYMAYGTGYKDDITQYTASRKNYILWPQNITNPLNKDATTGAAFSAGQLISPDGNVITPSGNNQTDVMKASHIRITGSWLNGATKISRTIDLPLPWMVMDTANTSNNAENARLVVVDTVGGGPSVEPDTVSDPNNVNKNNSSAAGNLINASVSDQATSTSYQKIGRFHYNLDYLWWVFFGTDVRNATNDGTTPTTPAGSYAIPDITTAKAWKNGVASLTRFQALKYATISAWLANQNKVWWGARFLDGSEEKLNTVSADNGNGSGTIADRNINLFRPAANSSSANSSVLQFATFEPSTSTPLTYAFANSYTQFAYTSDASSSFGTSSGGGQSGTEKPIPACRKSFFVVFTDGLSTDGYTSAADGTAIGDYDPYSAGTESNGNSAVTGYGLSSLDPSYASGHSGHGMFNIWTLSGIAAHYPPPYKTTPSSGSASYKPSEVAPFEVTSRGASNTAPRQIRTMTVAMSVGGSIFNASLPQNDAKKALYRAALYGNPDNTSWNLTDTPYDPTDANSDPSVNPFFFDATSVDKLTAAMTAILAEVTAAAGSISAPSSPLVGLSLGNQVYLGLFQTSSKSPRWQGDLLMAGLAVTSDGTFFVDNNANVTNSVSGKSAVWSVASSVFQDTTNGRGWKNRNLYTNINTATSSTNTTTLVPFNTSSGIPYAAVGAPDATTGNIYIRSMMGANSVAEVDGTTLTPRSDIMGDIINSSPIVLDYPITALTSSVSSKLTTFYGTKPSSGTSDAHFRVVFVGDNQGVFHAFGEVSWTTTETVTRTIIDNSTTPPTVTTKTYQAGVPTGAVDELWGFIPGEYLKYISYYRTKTNVHRYAMDGTPTVYFNDANADGLVDNGETVRVVIGQRKGGRSYYAFNFSDLSKVVSNDNSGGAIMSWKLVPDDTTVVANASQNNVMHGLGFSTSSPAIARVDTNSGTPKDLFFIGGGLSTSALDTSLAASYTSPSITKFGRSLVAFDVVNGPGTSLYTWNFNDSTFTTKFGSMGCIPAGVVPTDLVPGRGRAWRVYFSDTPTDANATATTPRGAGVWALGDTALFQTTDGASVGNVIREDSSNIDVWAGGATVNTTAGIRHILQTPTGYSITTPPAVFLLGNPSVYPAFRSAAPKTAPATVALTFGTGDRNDPTDQDSIDPGSANQNYLDVIFDRNDSSSLSGVAKVVTTNLDTAGMSQSTDLADLTSVSSLTDVNIVGAPYYLTQYLGYKLKMGAATAQATSGKYYYPKVITSATVLNGVLFFSDFLPGQGNSSACTGTGTTNTYRICDVMRPVFNGGTTAASSTTFNSGSASCSGIVLTFPNLPGEITSLGTTSIIQTGQGTSSTGGGDSNTINNTGANVGSGSANPNARTFKPRAWRVVR